MYNRVIPVHQFKTSTWAFGETTEMFIYPQDADYAKRQFLWRVSRASVTVENSNFTVLYGVKRWIMPLDGDLRLVHKNQGKPLYEIQMKPFQAHCFKGDWETESFGMVKDFNLMLKEGAFGLMKSYTLSANDSRPLSVMISEAFDGRGPIHQQKHVIAMYAESSVYLLDDLFVQAGELAMVEFTWDELENVQALVLKNTSDTPLTIILLSVSYEGNSV